MSGRAIQGLLCLAGVVAASCTGDPAPSPSPTPLPLHGDLVSVTSTQTESSLVRYRPSDASAQTIPSPIDPEAVNRSTIAGTTSANDALFVTANTRDLRAFSLPEGSMEVEDLGPPLDVAAGEEPSVQVTEQAVVVATCDRVMVLRLPAAERWIPAGGGCWAAVAPDGGRIALSPDGRRVTERSFERGRERTLFALSQLAPRMGVDAAVELVGTPTWGPAGLAFLVRAGDQLGVFVRESSGEIVEVLQERYANEFRVPSLAWQPDGGSLAIADDVGPQGAVFRVFDTETRELRALSLDPVGYAGMQWAPDGGSVAVLSATGVLLVIDLEGDWLLRRETDWQELLAWSETA